MAQFVGVGHDEQVAGPSVRYCGGEQVTPGAAADDQTGFAVERDRCRGQPVTIAVIDADEVAGDLLRAEEWIEGGADPATGVIPRP